MIQMYSSFQFISSLNISRNIKCKYLFKYLYKSLILIVNIKMNCNNKNSNKIGIVFLFNQHEFYFEIGICVL